MNPTQVKGTWVCGWTLDVHTTASEFIGYDSDGREQYDTTRSELGELVYQLKYENHRELAAPIAEITAAFLRDKQTVLSQIDLVVPIPASSTRPYQPVTLIASELARKLHKSFTANAIRRTKQASVKNIDDPDQRREALDGAFQANRLRLDGKRVLLVDDLFRSGATANAVAMELVAAGASCVYFLAVTRTRIKT